jgi:hypothetical protein
MRHRGNSRQKTMCESLVQSTNRKLLRKQAMPRYTSCEICKQQAEHSQIQSPHWREVRRCPQCGEFEFDGAAGLPENPSTDEMVRLSGWVRDQNADGVIPAQLTREAWHRAVHRRLPGLRERANLALGVIARRLPNLRKIINLTDFESDPELQGVTYSSGPDEATQLIDILLDDEYLKWAPGGSRGRDGLLTSKGLLAAEALRPSGSGAQGFVAMSFDSSLQEVWTNGFRQGIRAAGYSPVRLDDEDYVGGITDEIMAQIRRSRFVVADYTGQRHNVYFEAGFALGLGLTVIPTCRAEEADALQFDIRHLNTLVWKSHVELAESLDKRIRAVIGAGPEADPS